MPYHDAKTTMAARGQIQLRFLKRAPKVVTTFQCLVVSADPERLAMFERAATDGGWNTAHCSDAPTALAYINRSLVQLAIVDLESPQAEVFRPVVEQFTGASGLLLIVCGNEGDIEEEVWVRQLGAWLYLPGVVNGNNFALLCGEARQIAERLWKPQGADNGVGSPIARRNS